MNHPGSGSWPELWMRRTRPLVTVIPYVLLAVLVAFTVAQKWSAPGSLLIDLVLCGLAAAWMLWMITLHPAWLDRPRVMAVFMAGLLPIMVVLVIRDPWFGFFSPAGYIYAFALLSWPWELAGVVGVAVVAGTAQASGVSKGTALGVAIYVAVLVANVVPMCGASLIGRRSDEHSGRRERALSEVSQANRRLEAALAENAGLHQQLLVQAREAGIFDERQRMAREIHDTLAQGLTGIITQLQAVEQAAHDPVGWRRHLAAATGLARESLTEARRSVHELRPEPLETARLSEAISGVAERWSVLHGIPVEVATTGTVRPMPPEAEVALLRAAQEALANVAKHARAARIGVTLSYLEHDVALDVRDDGAGFDPSRLTGAGAGSARPGPAGGGAATEGGFGLLAMRQRIESLSGTLQIESELGGGTAVSACVPVPAGVLP
jgi:signal transduction histidine kinase